MKQKTIWKDTPNKKTETEIIESMSLITEIDTMTAYENETEEEFQDLQNRILEVFQFNERIYLVKKEYIDIGHSDRKPRYFFAHTDDLYDIIESCDFKNGIDLYRDQDNNFVVLVHGSGYHFADDPEKCYIVETMITFIDHAEKYSVFYHFETETDVCMWDDEILVTGDITEAIEKAMYEIEDTEEDNNRFERSNLSKVMISIYDYQNNRIIRQPDIIRMYNSRHSAG